VKVSVRLIGDGFAHAEALVADVRRRAMERLEARIAARENARASRTARIVETSAQAQQPPTR
jgi:hypothetical protein